MPSGLIASTVTLHYRLRCHHLSGESVSISVDARQCVGTCLVTSVVCESVSVFSCDDVIIGVRECVCGVSEWS